MSWMAEAHANSAATNRLPLRKLVEAREIPSQVAEYEARKAAGLYAMVPNWEVLGECGHRLEVFSPHQKGLALAKVAKGKRKRCSDCK